MKIRTLVLLGALPLLGGCVVAEPYDGRYPRQTTIEYNQNYDHGGHYRDNYYRTDWDHNRDDDWNDHHDRRDHFCPPGQAKKGRC